MPEGNAAGAEILSVRYRVPQPEALQRLWPLLAGELVTANVSQYDNQGAGGFASGDRLGNKKACNSEWQL